MPLNVLLNSNGQPVFIRAVTNSSIPQRVTLTAGDQKWQWSGSGEDNTFIGGLSVVPGSAAFPYNSMTVFVESRWPNDPDGWIEEDCQLQQHDPHSNTVMTVNCEDRGIAPG